MSSENKAGVGEGSKIGLRHDAPAQAGGGGELVEQSP
jgi:hypothetical protein